MTTPAEAAPWMEPGDLVLRHDVQLLRDEGLITVPITTWPLSWGNISRMLPSSHTVPQLSSAAAVALSRLRARARTEARVGQLRLYSRAALAEKPVQIRTFENTPRENAELEAAAAWMGRRFAFRLQGTVVDDPEDGRQVRLDGSYVGLALGNWMLSVNAMDRWWGPGWDGSLILSNNARPVPAIAVERNYSEPFRNRWLRWIGPWKLAFFLGQLESGRYVPHALLTGMRVNFAPTRKLEIGLSRTAQWGGEGRPQDLQTFWNMMIGRDNRGSDGIMLDNEPGNQLAGYDFRWRSPLFEAPYAVYGQLIGEDEAGGLPSRHIGLFGVETWGGWGVSGASYRLHLEYADTAVNFMDTPRLYNTAYNHGIYKSGYRYYSRSMGHAMDNDGRMFSLGGLLVESSGRSWRVLFRNTRLNRDDGGLNLVAPRSETRHSIDLSGVVPFGVSRLRWGVGLERRRIDATREEETDARVYVQWHHQL